MAIGSSAKKAIIGGVADLTIKNDVAGELNIRPAALQTLELLAQHGGEVPWSWEKISPASRDMVADMIVAELVVEREYCAHAAQLVPDRITLRLTDKGRNVIEIHRKRRIVAGEIKPVEVSS
jgi:hypothetical protein